MTTYNFPEVTKRGKKSGKCVVCNKRTTRSITVTHTVNPFNKNADGVPKSYEEVLADVTAKRDKWLAEPVMHEACE